MAAADAPTANRRRGADGSATGYQGRSSKSSLPSRSSGGSSTSGVNASGHRSRKGAVPQSGSSPSPSPPLVLSKATAPSEEDIHRASAVLEHPETSRKEAEAVLTKLSSWLEPPSASKALALLLSSGMPMVVVQTMRKFRNEPPVAALACIHVVRSSRGSAENAAAHVRAGAIEEIMEVMDRHPAHGGIQNVSLLLLSELMKDSAVARQAVAQGAVSRVLRALESTAGREVQYNGCTALRLLVDHGRVVRMLQEESGREVRTGIQEAAMKAKEEHEGDETLCALANDVLSLVTPRFKEVLCWHWQNGWCRLGARCTYAHGPEELRGS